MSLIPPSIITALAVLWVLAGLGDKSMAAILGLVIRLFAAGLLTGLAWLMWGVYALLGLWH